MRLWLAITLGELTVKLDQSSPRIKALKDEGKARREGLRNLVPDPFTSQQLADASGLTPNVVRCQIKKMLKWGEVEPTSHYKNPREYRRITK